MSNFSFAASNSPKHSSSSSGDDSGSPLTFPHHHQVLYSLLSLFRYSPLLPKFSFQRRFILGTRMKGKKKTLKNFN